MLFTQRNTVGAGGGGGGAGGGGGGGGRGAGGGALTDRPASWFQLDPTGATTIGSAKAIPTSASFPNFENPCNANRACPEASTPIPPPAWPGSGLGAANECTVQVSVRSNVHAARPAALRSTEYIQGVLALSQNVAGLQPASIAIPWISSSKGLSSAPEPREEEEPT